MWLVDRDDVPAWLTSRPEGPAVQPGVESHSQLLPLNDLNSKDFERLCYQAIRRESEVENCGLYGVPGQRQDGIDLYARRRDNAQYSVYQCKRVEEFRPADIREAVSN